MTSIFLILATFLAQFHRKINVNKKIIRASCVGCGVCSAVCPRGVLKLENGKTYGDRFEGSARPIQAFIDSMKHV